LALIIRPSLRGGLRLIARSPRGPGFFAPVMARHVTAQLDLSVGRPGPHAFAVRADADRRRHQPVHRIPHATSVTTRPPLFKSQAGRGGASSDLGWGVKRDSENQNASDATSWHDGQFAHGAHARSACRASRVAYRKKHVQERTLVIPGTARAASPECMTAIGRVDFGEPPSVIARRLSASRLIRF
jgi:hypothetical protein